MRLGYVVLALEHWLERGGDGSAPVLILRHDVDQHPGAALRMAAIERRLGVRSTWYFRWRSADPRVIRRVRRGGSQVGLHYETLTRTLLERRFGPCRSACPHGDTRVPGVTNAGLLRDADLGALGLRWDGNEAMRGRGLDLWLTDRSPAAGGWRDGIDPIATLRARRGPILLLTHPNNWASGPRLWLDRALGAALPGRLPLPARTRGDGPPTA